MTSVFDTIIKEWEDLLTRLEKGGPGSGHHGHAGRPGKVGGSLPSDDISIPESEDRMRFAANVMNPIYKPVYSAEGSQAFQREMDRIRPMGIEETQNYLREKYPEQYRDEVLEVRQERADMVSRIESHREALEPLIKQTRHYDSFEEFRKDFSLNGFVGYYWHVTSEPDFEIDPHQVPTDLSSLASGSSQGGPGGLMVTGFIEGWAEIFNPSDMPEELRGPGRHYAALIDLSDLEPNVDFRNTTRGFGHEIFVFKPEGAKVVDTFPLSTAINTSRRYLHEIMPQSKRQLHALWDYAQSEKSISKGGPGSGHFGHEGRPGKVGGSQPSEWNPFTSNAYDSEKVFKHRVARAVDTFARVTGSQPTGITFTNRWDKYVYAWAKEAGVGIAEEYDKDPDLFEKVVADFRAEQMFSRRGALLPKTNLIFVNTDIVNLAQADGLDTVFHELAHWLDYSQGWSMSNAMPKGPNSYWVKISGWYGEKATYREYFADLIAATCKGEDESGNYRWGSRFAGRVLTPQEESHRQIAISMADDYALSKQAEPSVLVVFPDEIMPIPVGDLTPDMMLARDLLKHMTKRARLSRKGGPGSGHHGHAGRPGKVGGSKPSTELGMDIELEGHISLHVDDSEDERMAARERWEEATKVSGFSFHHSTGDETHLFSDRDEAVEWVRNDLKGIHQREESYFFTEDEGHWKPGGPDSVGIGANTIKKMRKAAKDGQRIIHLHNHPDDGITTMPSSGDWQVWVATQITTAYVVNADLTFKLTLDWDAIRADKTDFRLKLVGAYEAMSKQLDTDIPRFHLFDKDQPDLVPGLAEEIDDFHVNTAWPALVDALEGYVDMEIIDNE